MFFDTPGKPTLLKKIVYLIAATVLGVLLSFMVHAFLEINYLNLLQSQGRVASFYNGCALPPDFSDSLFLLGAVGGFFLGRFWWRMIYIDRVWAKKRKK